MNMFEFYEPQAICTLSSVKQGQTKQLRCL